jgi:hypothetical protein
MVDWPFLFRAMEKLGFPGEFISMTNLLFHEASATVKVNGSQSMSFPIQRGVRQGCPLAPYLFLIMAEVLNSMIKIETAAGRIRGIQLPVEDRQQVLAQYADDTSLTLLGEEDSAKVGILTLKTFCMGCGLVLNWEKSCGYWKDGGRIRPVWTEQLGVSWIDDEQDLSKLLGTPFGLSMSAQCVDEFLVERVHKSLRYWCTTKVNSTGRGVVVNKILLSSIFFFISIWDGTQKGIARVKANVASYMWSGTMNRARTKVAWLQCCQPKDQGGLDLVNPADALVALMAKWITKACEPGTSNLHAMIRFRLVSFQPYSGGRWEPSLEHFTQHKFQARRGSKVWNRIGLAWRALVKDVVPALPRLGVELLNESFWWSSFTPMIGAGFAKSRAATLHRAGLVQIRDAWVGDRFLSHNEGMERFGLTHGELGAWNECTRRLVDAWGPLLQDRNPVAAVGEWLGCFEEDVDTWPRIVLQVGPRMEHLRTDNLPIDWWLPAGASLFTVLPISNCLEPVCAADTPHDGVGPDTRIRGTLRRVRITSIKRGPQKKVVHLYYGRLDLLKWDPDRFLWAQGTKHTPFLDFTAALGRSLMRQRHVIPNLVEKKWQGVLPLNFRLKWKTVWVVRRTPKEAGLLWLTWHRSVAVNMWRGRINQQIDTSCPVCPRRSEESVLHRFWECLSAQRAWQWGIHIMNVLITSRDAKGPWRPLTWKQGIFSDRIPRKFDKVCSAWMVIRTVVLWTLWTERNDVVFNNSRWPADKLLHRIWIGIIDYGRVDWARLQSQSRKQPGKLPSLSLKFGNRWCTNGVFAVMEHPADRDQLPVVRWILSGPLQGFVFQVH